MGRFLGSHFPCVQAMCRNIVDTDFLLSTYIHRHIGIGVSLIGIRVDAGHRHVKTVEGIATLPLQFSPLWDLNGFLVFIIRGHLRGFTHVLRIEVALRETRDMWGHHFLAQSSIPVDICTPRVVLDAPDLPLCDAPPRILVQHQLEQVGQLGRNELSRKLELLIEGTHEHFVLICWVERRQACYHLVEDGTQTIVVYAIAVRVTIEHFWTHILGWATICFVQIAWLLDLGQTKVC